jgi:tetratricopeptide (TPR) repeat protein
VNKSWFGALGNAKAARHDHEKALELDPKFNDARLVVGIHLYIVGSLPWPIRLMAHVVGESGNKSEGMKDIGIAADGGGDAAVDASVVRALFLRREEHFKEALRVQQKLTAGHPRNFLFATEEANILKDAGMGPQSIAAYRKVLAEAAAGRYFDPHLEFAYYGLGEALRGQRDYAGAAEAYDAAARPGSNPAIRVRAELGAGEMYDLLQQRERAMQKYESVIANNSESPKAEAARKNLKKPYRMDADAD